MKIKIRDHYYKKEQKDIGRVYQTGPKAEWAHNTLSGWGL